jgi:hypothetical protein
VTGSRATTVPRSVANCSNQQHSAVHVSHSTGLPVVEESMHTAEDMRTSATHREHLRHKGQLFETTTFVQGFPYFGPGPYFNQVAYNKLMAQ